MTTLRRLLPVLVLSLLVPVAVAQNEDPAPQPEPEAARPATPAPREEPPPAQTREQQDEAVRALMGEPRRPEQPDPAPEEPTRRERRPDERRETASEQEPLAPPRTPAATRTPSRPAPVPEGAVPRVPTVTPQPITPADEPAPVTPDPWEIPLPERPQQTPVDDPFTTTDPDATALLGDEMDEAFPAEDEARAPSSPATAIVVGLIVLAVLLVALAAVVGVMAAQRAQTNGAAATPPGDLSGWAYLAAPNAPNISLQKSPFMMGSAANCDLRLADPKASPQHARVDQTDDGYVLTDLNSANGTFLNGERIASPVSLRPGDEVRMGDIMVTFEVHSS